jgi:hypothetical protein
MVNSGSVIEIRKLAALEVLFLGPKLVVVEYACGVLLSAGLGIFVLVRGHTLWQTLVGAYLICLGLNYLPLLLHAIALRDPQAARAVIEGELGDTRKTFSRYRSQSLFLLVPLLVAIVGVSQSRRIHS